MQRQQLPMGLSVTDTRGNTPYYAVNDGVFCRILSCSAVPRAAVLPPHKMTHLYLRRTTHSVCAFLRHFTLYLRRLAISLVDLSFTG